MIWSPPYSKPDIFSISYFLSQCLLIPGMERMATLVFTRSFCISPLSIILFKMKSVLKANPSSFVMSMTDQLYHQGTISNFLLKIFRNCHDDFVCALPSVGMARASPNHGV